MHAFQLEASPRDPLAALHGEIAPVQVSPLYRLGLFIVALAMILLPLIYLALIAGVGYGVYYHAINHTAILVGGSFVWRLLAYLAPIVAGAILVFFMIKPLFVEVHRPAPLVTLARGQQPLLFDFIAKICAIVRAPMPSAVNVNCDVNAYASFSRGLASFWSNDLELTIGLPLVHGMRMDQLAGIFAHEFGHFAQGTGMRLTFLIRNVNLWFARVVYERDAWDQKLVAASENSDFRLALILHLARFFVWLTRKILWALMMLGHVISSFMLRQMEYDADRYEARLAGSDTFASTVRQLRRLSFAQQSAYAYLNEQWKDGRLASDFPAFVAAKLAKLPHDFNQKDEAHLAQTKTGFFDTHPCDQDRIASAAREHAPGLFRLAAPATELFQNLDALSQQTSHAHYQLLLGNAFSEGSLTSNQDFLQREQALDAGHETASRYFQNLLLLTRPLVVIEQDLALPALGNEEFAQRMQTIRASLLEQLPETRRALQSHRAEDANQLVALEEDWRATLNLAAANGARIVVPAPPVANPMEITRATETLQRVENELRTRLASALAMIHHSYPSLQLNGAEEFRQELRALLPPLEKFNEAREDLRQLQREFIRMNVALMHAARLQGDADNYRIVTRTINSAYELQRKILGIIGRAHYPFEHAKGRLTLAQFALPVPPTEPEFSAVFNACSELSDNLFSFYFRAMGRLALMAEQVETTLGLEALPMPEPQA